MRLGQLARKLAVRPSELVEFLTTKNIATESGSNTRLEEQTMRAVVQHFAPTRVEELMAEDEQAEVTPQPALIVEPEIIPEPTVKSVEPIDKITEPVIALADSNLPEEENKSAEVEVIKAAKVELQGLKVIGKIELPEVNKKPPTEAVESSTPSTTPQAERRVRSAERNGSNPQRERTQQREWINPIALQREKEAEEAERKRKADIEREKEKRTQKYLSKVKSAPIKSMKRSQEYVEEIEDDVIPPPKTWLGKLFRWFRT